jgi:hypothetical protein
VGWKEKSVLIEQSPTSFAAIVVAGLGGKRIGLVRTIQGGLTRNAKRPA